MLDVVAEKQDQVFKVEKHVLPVPAKKIVDVAKTVIFDRVVIFRDAAIVQGKFHKRIQFVDECNFKRDFQTDIPFSKKVELPGLTPTVTVGKANRAVITNNIVEIGPDNVGTIAGIDVQLYVKQIQNVEELKKPLPSRKVIEKIDLDFLIKISKAEQVKMNVEIPQVFECRNVKPCVRNCDNYHHY